MEWLAENLMVIIFYVFIIYMFAQIFFQIHKAAKNEKEEKMTKQIPDCTPLIAQYILKDGEITPKVIKAVFLDLCKKNYIKLVPMTNENDDIKDYELIKNGVPNFKEKEYEENLFNEEFEDSDISLSYIYILNKYIFSGKEKNLYSIFSRELDNVNLNEDLLFVKILTAEMFSTNLFKTESENLEEVEVTEKGEEVSKNIEGLKLFLRDYDLIGGFKKDDIETWGKYLTYGVAYELEDLSIENLNILYAMDYFNIK